MKAEKNSKISGILWTKLDSQILPDEPVLEIFCNWSQVCVESFAYFGKIYKQERKIVSSVHVHDPKGPHHAKIVG